jgi:RimJ/RimL family protein N-acetyltransferase
MTWLEPITLKSDHAVLEPLDRRHEADLIEAARDGELWDLWYTNVPTEADMGKEIDRRLALQKAGSMLPFAITDPKSGKAVGITTYMAADAVNRRVEIGYTWYRKSVQRTAMNTSCKLMLLTHAFEKLDCIAVEFRTHFFNHASRRGIERLGAKLDGILRSHQISRNGTLRDTSVYSIIASEWPTVKGNLTWQLSRPRG